MFSRIARIFSGRAAGLLASLTALILAVVLGVTLAQGRHEREFLKARIAALAARDASQLQVELASCRAAVRSYAAAASASGAPRRDTALETTVGHDPNTVAAELARTPPAGFDVCARMESADRAVLRSLGRR